MAQKYYNSAEVAKLLGKSVDDVKKMLESRELHGYRDGADWKFKAEDIDKLAVNAPPTSDEDEGGDVLLSDAALGQSDTGLSGTVIGMSGAAPVIPDSDVRLAESDSEIVDQSQATPPPKPASTGDSKPFEELELDLAEDLTLEDSSQMLKNAFGQGGDSSLIDLGDSKSLGDDNSLEDDNLILGGSGAGSNLSIGGDSGISLIDPSDSGFSLETPVNLGASDESLELGEDDLLAAEEPIAEDSSSMLQADDEFMLTPLEEVTDEDDSETGSQVIALDTEEAEATATGAAAGSMAAMLDEDFGAPAAVDMGMSAPAGESPFMAGQPAVEGAAVSPSAYSFEAPYSVWQIVGLAFCVFLLMMCGMMIFDLLRTMWSWDEPFTVNSGLMDTILGWIEG